MRLPDDIFLKKYFILSILEKKLFKYKGLDFFIQEKLFSTK